MSEVKVYNLVEGENEHYEREQFALSLGVTDSSLGYSYSWIAKRTSVFGMEGIAFIKISKFGQLQLGWQNLEGRQQLIISEHNPAEVTLKLFQEAFEWAKATLSNQDESTIGFAANAYHQQKLNELAAEWMAAAKAKLEVM